MEERYSAWNCVSSPPPIALNLSGNQHFKMFLCCQTSGQISVCLQCTKFTKKKKTNAFLLSISYRNYFSNLILGLNRPQLNDKIFLKDSLGHDSQFNAQENNFRII